MIRYTVKRILMMFLTLFIVTTITFFLMHSVPGDPLASMAKKLPDYAVQNFYAKYGLDKPVTEQYFIFLKNLITEGDLGESITKPGRSVSQTIAETAPISAQWGFIAMFIGIAIGTLLGIIAAYNRGKWPDYVVTFIAMLGVCIPSFVFASLLQYLLAGKWRLVPTAGWGKPIHFILPCTAAIFGPIATYARYTRSSVLEVLNQDYILTAEAKGVSRSGILFKHVLRNAMLPLITMIGPQVAGVFTGSFVLERMFSIPGLGRYFVESINARDYTMIIGTTVFYAALFIFSVLIVDLVYGLVDPRIRLSGRKA